MTVHEALAAAVNGEQVRWVYWDSRINQWIANIGYYTTSSGKRTQRQWRFGKDEASAISSSKAKWSQWEEVRKIHKKNLLPGLPVWRDEDFGEKVAEKKQEQEQEKIQRLDRHQYGRNFISSPTIEQVKQAFLDEQESGLELVGALSRKQTTISSLKTTISALFKGQETLLALPLASLHLETIKSFRDSIHSKNRKPKALSPRSAANYCRQFHSILIWAEKNKNKYNWTRPQGTESLFEFGRIQPEIYIPSTEEVKDLIKEADEQTKLFILLALNCGFTQIDISDVKVSELVKHEKEDCIWRQRSKTSHQLEGDTLHWLFPETVKLLNQFQKKNPLGLLFVSDNGKPLEQRPSTQNISDLFNAAKEKVEEINPKFTFKSLRKFGSQTIKYKLQKSPMEEEKRLYLGRKVQGVDSRYEQDDFKSLTAALKKMHKYLKKEGVL